jgi:hypothetical protein
MKHVCPTSQRRGRTSRGVSARAGEADPKRRLISATEKTRNVKLLSMSLPGNPGC